MRGYRALDLLNVGGMVGVIVGVVAGMGTTEVGVLRLLGPVLLFALVVVIALLGPVLLLTLVLLLLAVGGNCIIAGAL